MADTCPNCGKALYETHVGITVEAQRLCRCGEGCYFVDDDYHDPFPGAASGHDVWIGKCCKCGQQGQR